MDPPAACPFPRLDPNIYPALAQPSSDSSVPRSPSPTSPSSPTSPASTSARRQSSSSRPLSPISLSIPPHAHPRPSNPRSRSAASLPLLPSSLHDLHDLRDLLPDHTHPCCRPPVFVLAADGSSVYRLDPKPGAEDPPPYAPFQRARAATAPAHAAGPSTSPGLDDPDPPHRTHSPDPYEPNPEETEMPAATRVGATLRTILCGDRGIALPSEGDSPWRRYWAPLTDPAHWRPLPHLLLPNFPLALALWPPLLAGTLAGTALLLTLPLGAVVWWLTLLLARWGAALELRLQAVHAPMPQPRVVFYRLRELPDAEAEALLGESPAERDTRFLANSWAMFTDHYSYAALAYFLLFKPLAVLPTLLFIALFPVCLVLVPLLPIYLRAAAAYGRAQARLAASNL